MPEGKPITLTSAKGRPMLTWVGKRPLERVTAFPAQLVERFNPVEEPDQGGLVFHGDNKDVLAWLLANGYRGKINLVYIDPPFDSGADYVRKVELRGGKGSTKLDGDGYTLGEQVQYTDIWTNDNYLQFMYERLLMAKELLSTNASIYLHCDWHKVHHLRCLMDEIFGADNFRNEIVWKRQSAHNDSRQYGAIHDSILYYTVSEERTWNEILTEPSPDYIEQFFDQVEPNTNRRYARGDLTAGGLSGSGYEYEYKGVLRIWRCPKSTMEKYEAEGRLHWPKEGVPRLKRYLDEFEGVPLQDVWHDLRVIHNQSSERTGYPTQKPEIVMERIIKASSNPGDLLLDCFAGSGTTASVAQKLGRRWIIADINKGAVQTASKRLQCIIREQIEAEARMGKQSDFMELVENTQPEGEQLRPASHSFAIYRVNDYDLQIQHNEAVNLAIEHVGIERIKGDPFFDGLYGARLVKIVPFNHSLTLLDLQLVQDALAERKDDARDITLVCLGKETAVDPWLADYNRRHPVNKIDVIELRTDPRYGKFFEHKPASAQVEIARRDGQIVVEITDFMSPTILERLEMDANLFQALVTDWRAMVDTVLIDAAYDGQVFNVALSDVPERKSDLVAGHYTLPASDGETTVAVKIIDMLGEEVLVVQKV